MTTLRDVTPVLGRHGIEPGPRGYELATLERAILARGWRHRTEERRNRGARYQALVFARLEGVAPTDPDHVSSLWGRGRGATEEEALALALTRMLLRAG